jgi:hypothetical protein
MVTVQKPFLTLTDFITGKEVPDIGAEANRQVVEKRLVEEKRFLKSEIAVDVNFEITVGGEPYRSQVDLLVTVNNRRFMAVKCVAGSLGSREREIVAAARLIDSVQIPFSVVTDGQNFIVLDTITGKKTGEGIGALPSREQAESYFISHPPTPLSEKKREQESRIFRTYDVENTNVFRKMVRSAPDT